MKRILLGCVLVVFGLILGVQVATAQQAGPPQTHLVPLPRSYDVDKAKEVERSLVVYLVSKQAFEREIYEVPGAVIQPPHKYAVKEMKVVSRPEYVPVWYEVSPHEQPPTYKWKYVTRRGAGEENP